MTRGTLCALTTATMLITSGAFAQDHQHHPPAHPTQPAEQGHAVGPPPAHEHDHSSAKPAAQEHDHSSHGAPRHSPASPDSHAHHAGAASEPAQSEREHVPPDPPSRQMHDMPYKAMVEMMAMDDTARFSKVLVDQLDWRESDNASVIAWDMQAWYGSDYNKLWFKTEGERSDGTTQDARAELLWDRIFSRWWSVQTGLRHDFGQGPSRDWLALGVQGLAPWFFEIEATAYLGEGGRTAARFSAEYDLLLTQRLILQPELEFNLYGESDRQRGIGSGLSDAQLGLRLRYELRREIAPYVGVAWVRHFGNTADLRRASGEDDSDVEFLAGIRFWF